MVAEVQTASEAFWVGLLAANGVAMFWAGLIVLWHENREHKK